MSFYERQLELKLDTDISITCVGCGGIGFWVAKFAAMSGIKTIFAFDPDVIEEHNLNRLDIPERFIGRNKADMVEMVVKMLRPDCNIYARPFKFQSFNYTRTDWIIDCTDKYKSQVDNYNIAKSTGTKYLKSGYDGESFSINNVVAQWGEAEDGYVITPSWVVPATIIAALTVAKVMKYHSSEISSSISEMLKEGKENEY